MCDTRDAWVGKDKPHEILEIWWTRKEGSDFIPEDLLSFEGVFCILWLSCWSCKFVCFFEATNPIFGAVVDEEVMFTQLLFLVLFFFGAGTSNVLFGTYLETDSTSSSLERSNRSAFDLQRSQMINSYQYLPWIYAFLCIGVRAEDSSQDPATKFLQWCFYNDISAPKLGIKHFEGFGRGVYAIQDIKVHFSLYFFE